jgi:hypothetical protein
VSISTASELQSAVANWSNRTDLADRFGEFVALFEAKANRRLRVRAMEAAFDSVALVSGAATLPASFLAFKELRYDGSPSWALEPRPLQWVRDQSDQATPARYYAVTDTQVVCWPQDGSVKGTYYKQIPSLTANSTNWLLTTHPGVYLFGCLEQVAFYLRDQQMLQNASTQLETLLDQVQGADNANALNGGPLQVRPQVMVR